MSYTKTTWRNNQAPAINADNLNHMEQGIESAHNQIDVNTSNIESLTTQVQNNATNIASEISARQTTDSSLQSQIDQLVAPTGEAPNPAEIENARIGDDGVTYDTLGNAIRTQFSNVKSDLTNETNARILLAGRVTTAEGDIDTLETHKVAQPLDEHNQPTNGTDGQSLRTKGDGTTEWADVGLPTDEQTAQAVNDWLDAHPEATTTVDFAVVTKVFPTVTRMTEDLTLTVGDTIRTTGYYANNDKAGGLFRVSDVADSGSTQSILLSNGLYAVRIKDVCVTPQMFGAKGNWESNPASNFYSSMEDLLKDYPLAQSLSDEMDLLAVESAIAKNNRILYIPTGGYYFNRTITLPVGQVIFGDGTANTQITYNGTDSNMLIVNSNVIIKDLKLTHKVILNVVGTESTVTAIKAFSTNRSRYEGVQINGFDYGINFNVNSWCNYLINCSINYCNYGISGQNEFNAVVISQCALSYNNYGIRVGSGRTIVIEKCTLERNNYGITKFDHGDIIVKGCYFELHNNRSIYVIYSSYPVELITIQDCSFYTNTDDEVFIGLAGNSKTLANIIYNIFECNANSLGENETIKCIQSSSNAIIFNIDNNFLFTGCEIGVDSKYIKGYTDNGKHIVSTSSSNLASAFNNGVKSVRFEFSTNGTVTLPDLSNVADGEEVRKFVGLWTGGSDYTDASIMNIDTTGKTIYGEKIVRPNVMYSIYYQKSNNIYFIFK